MDINTIEEQAGGRDLLSRHLTVTAEAEQHGFSEVAANANYVWHLHEIALEALQEYLGQVRQ
jgi:hypothetical protein